MKEYPEEETLAIRVYPDPVLKARALPVEKFDAELASFVEKMRAAMDEHDGVGLAAPQVGVSKRIAIVSYQGNSYVLINPQIIEEDGEQEGEEGCLSFPGIFAKVTRPSHVKVSAQDPDGTAHTYDVEDFTARAFLHEMEHLDGTLFIDHLSNLKRGMIRKKMQKRAKEQA